MDFNDISNDCVKPLRALRFSLILNLGDGTVCCFFVLGAGIGPYGGIGLASLYYYMKKLLQFDWLRAVVFQLNLKYLHVKITNLLRVVV